MQAINLSQSNKHFGSAPLEISRLWPHAGRVTSWLTGTYPGGSISKDMTATFLDSSGNRISSTVLQPGFAAVNVPNQAASVQFEKDGAASESRALSNNPVQSADVKIVPQSESIVSVNFPLNVRPSTGSKAVIGVAHVGQRLRIDEVRNYDNLYWAAVSVVE
jgi:hypothetical protein